MQWTPPPERPSAARFRRWPAAPWRLPRWPTFLLPLLLALLLATETRPAAAQALAAVSTQLPSAAAAAPDLGLFELTRSDEGLLLAFAVNLDLPRGVEDALQKGVPLYFVAQADVYRSRWYWRDRRVASVERTWRLAFQPLTRKYRVSFGGLNQTFDTLPDAMVAVRRVAGWKLADPAALEPGASHYVEFRYRLDTSLLPRPLQIGLGGQADWNLQVERLQQLE